VRSPGPGAQTGAQQLQVGDDDERTHVQQLRAAPEQEGEQAHAPERTENIRPWREGAETPQGIASGDDGCGGHQGTAVPQEERGAGHRKCGEIHQPVAGRHEGGNVVEAVDVHMQPWRERVLDQRGEDHNNRDLCADQSRLSHEQPEQQCPAQQTQQALTCLRARLVHDQHHRDPQHHQGRRHRVSLPGVDGDPCGPSRWRWSTTTGRSP
jgi:hypothetical protein